MAGYGDGAGFIAWLAANGHSLPSEAPAAAVLLERGTTYVDGLYFDRFPGTPTGGATQARQWPRVGACDRWGNSLASDSVPDRVVKASYEAAWIEANSPGTLSRTFTPGERKVLTEVKGIKWQITGDGKSERAMVLTSTAIEGLLGPILLPDDVPAIMVV